MNRVDYFLVADAYDLLLEAEKRLKISKNPAWVDLFDARLILENTMERMSRQIDE